MDMFDKWDKEIDVEGLQKDIEDAAKNGGNFKEVPHGVYEVTVDKMELTESKKHDPMVSIWFKVAAGEYKGSRIFYNQVVNNGTGIHFNNELLRSMELETVEEAEAKGKLFRSYRQYADLLLDCAEEIERAKLSFQLNYAEGKNGFNKYTIEDIFEN
jgi:hypothetical protein